MNDPREPAAVRGRGNEPGTTPADASTHASASTNTETDET